MTAVEKLSLVCNRLAERSLLALGLLMALVVMLQVFSRYLLNHSLFWSEELARFLLIWLTFLGASVAYFRKAHPGINLLYCRLAPNWQRRCRVFTGLLALAFFLVMIWYGTLFAHFVRAQYTPALALPKWAVFMIIPISGMLMSIHTVAEIGRELHPDGILK